MYCRKSSDSNKFSRRAPAAAAHGRRKRIYNPFKFNIVINENEINYSAKCDKFCYIQTLFGVPKFDLMNLMTKKMQSIRNELMHPDDKKHFSSVCSFNGDSRIIHPKVQHDLKACIPVELDHDEDKFTFVLILLYLEDVTRCPQPAIICVAAAVNIINYSEDDEIKIIQQFCKLTRGDVTEKYYPCSTIDDRRVIDPCLICYVNPATTVMRCWHSILCRRCSLNFKPCLICADVHGLDYIEFPSASDGEDDD